MARFIIYGILIYLLYLGLRTFLNKFSRRDASGTNFKEKFGNSSQNQRTNRNSKRDFNNIEDADYEEIKKP